RGERAGLDRFAAAIQTGKVTLEGVFKGDRFDWRERTYLAFASGEMHQRVALLRHRNRTVETGQLPHAQQAKLWWKIRADARVHGGPLVARLLVNTESANVGYRRSQAFLRCALVALAAQLYWLECGEWPESAEQLVTTGHLQSVPLDPFDE